MKKLLLLLLTLLSFAANAQTRLGLHTTSEELVIWRQRALGATATDYKVASDVSTNSPGDWTRIAANASSFNTSSTARTGDIPPIYTGTGCWPKGSTYEPSNDGNLIRDAAFYYLIKEDASYLANIKTQLLSIVRNPRFDYSDATLYCTSSTQAFGDGNPGFAISEWLTKLAFAYDYVNIGGGWSGPEIIEITAFFYKAGVFFSNSMNAYYGKRYVDRLGGNYTLTQYTIGADAGSPHQTMYLGSPATGFGTNGYSNRMMTIGRFVAVAGILTNESTLLDNGKRMFKEMMMFGIFPNGDIADLYRWKSPANAYEGPESGLNYSWSVVGAMGDIADVFARKGDSTLYAYSTESGAFGTASPGNPKTLLQVMLNMCKYRNGTHVRYGGTGVTYTYTNASTGVTTGPFATLIDGNEPHLAKGDMPGDVWLSLPNQYYKSAIVTNNYKRTASGTRAYASPATTRNTGPNPPWCGQAGIYPGSLFMFGQMEGVAYPYPSDKQNQTLTVSSPAAQVWGNPPFAFTATASSGLTPTIVVTGPGYYSSGYVTITGVGTINIVVTQAGNASYYPAPAVTRSVVVSKATPTINFPAIPTHNVSDPPIVVSPTSSAGLTVATVSNSGVLTASAPNTFTINSAGTGSITASTAATANYNAASVTRTFPIVNDPVTGVSDLLEGKSVDPGSTTVEVNDTTHYSLFQIVYELGGTYSPHRLVFATGTSQGLDIIKAFKVYYYISGAWVLKNTVAGNQLAVYDITFTPFAGASKLKITAEGYNIFAKMDIEGTHLYGE